MNERIEELAGKAFEFASENADETGQGQLGIFAEKFAELIVQECVELFADDTNEQEMAHGRALRQMIKEHFGVK